jgi:site-specific recombinase XerD
MRAITDSTSFATLVQEFFCKYLIAQRGVSGRTVCSYRDTFRLLLRYRQAKSSKPSDHLTLADFDAHLVLEFLDHVENERDNTVRSRNNRLAAIRTFMRYVSLRDPVSLPIAQRVLAIPMKRFDHPGLTFLTVEEMRAIITAPDPLTWSGRRDQLMLATFYNTGARVSEIIGLRWKDVQLSPNQFVQIHGKGRKQRTVPLWKETARQLAEWLRANADAQPEAAVFPNRHGKPLSRNGVETRLRKAVEKASAVFPSLKTKSISPHTIRHSTALHLLQAGVDLTVIAMWLGHESPATTHRYIEANLEMKERALSKLEGIPPKTRRWKPDDRLLAFLDTL